MNIVKKIVVVLLMVVSVELFAGELNNHAQILKDKKPATYEAIVKRAGEQWGTDYEMKMYEVNLQADALFEIIVLLQEIGTDYDIFYSPLYSWADVSRSVINKCIEEGGELFELPMDFSMIAYEMRNQINAKAGF